MSCVLAVILDALLGEPRRWHPLNGFGALAKWLEQRHNKGPAGPGRVLRGALCTLALVVPAVALCALLMLLLPPLLGWPLQLLILYFCIARRSLGEHLQAVVVHLERGNLGAARRAAAAMVSRDCRAMAAPQVAGAALESTLENGGDALAGALFWFMVGGAPAVLGLRLINTLDALWGYRDARHGDFGRLAARLDDACQYLPSRILAALWLAAAHLAWGRRAALRALACWRRQARRAKSPNAGVLVATGAGALGVRLDPGPVYGGRVQPRLPPGTGGPPGAADCRRALRLVNCSLWLWLALALAWQALLPVGFVRP